MPKAIGGGGPILGPVRADFVPREKTTSFSVAFRGHEPILVAADGERHATLTVRNRPTDSRRRIAANEWHIDDGARVVMPTGFKPGRIYKVVYQGSGSRVGGLGYSAVRDLVAARDACPCDFRRRGAFL